jgi:hypothetical protein
MPFSRMFDGLILLETSLAVGSNVVGTRSYVIAEIILLRAGNSCFRNLK